MDEVQARRRATQLVEESQICMLGTVDPEGAPQIKAVIRADHVGMAEVWISTNTSSEHVAQLAREPRACLYFGQWESEPWRGLTLGGRIEILRDRVSRERLWSDGCERYYPKGIDDPDYTVLRFTAEWGKYYESLTKTRFELP